jgi:hypothetical protein
MDALGRASQGWGPHAELESILASDDHIIAFFHAISEQDGKTLDVVLAEPRRSMPAGSSPRYGSSPTIRPATTSSGRD